jgi:hypothetical protein
MSFHKKPKSKKKKINYSGAILHNKAIEVNCIIYGKSTAPYHIPKKIQIWCTSDDNYICLKCSQKKDHIFDLIPKDESILRFIDIHTGNISKVIKSVFNLKCKFSFEILEYQSIQRISVIPPTDQDKKKTIGLTPTAYFVGELIDINCKYRMIGYTTTHPTDQTVTHVFIEAQKERSDVDSFQLTEDIHKQLNEFSRKFIDATEVFDYLEKLYDVYAHNITKIFGRFDLHLCIDLVFRSPLSFRMGNEYVPKGWADIMILGDTSLGKNYVASRLSSYYRIGEMIGAENVTFAGLVGGLQQIGGKHWTVTWGKIPLHDGDLLIIDEASELKHSDWTKLSRIRSEGIAEVTKINTQQTSAKTRLIFLANPIEKNISNYSHGIQALQDLIKQSEDIRRFDYVLIVSHNDVSIDEINKRRETKESLYTSEMERNLILWAWSRKLDEIIFSDAAIESIYKRSKHLAKQYSFSIPLIQGENVRIKIAKLAICFAARLYSNKKNGKILFVDKIHVDCVMVFIQMIYEKVSSGYLALSKLNAKTEAAFSKEDFLKFAEYLNSYVDKKTILEYLIKNDIITSKAMSEYTGRDVILIQEIISKLLQFDHIIPAGSSSQRYMKTSAFTYFLKIMVVLVEKKIQFKDYVEEEDEENE